MGAAGRGLPSIIGSWVRQLLYYNWGDIKSLLWNFLLVVTGAGLLAYLWTLGYDGGITQNVLRIVDGWAPGPSGPAFMAPVGFITGAISIFWIDPYKRLQGLLVLVPGLLTVFGVGIASDHFNHEITPMLIGVIAVSFLFGLVWAGLIEAATASGKPQMKQAFGRLRGAIIFIGILGIIESTVSYTSPIQYSSSNPAEVAGGSVPATLTTPAIGQITVAPLVIGSIAILLLSVSFRDFTSYERDKKVLILGPDRAGKTWLMGGAGFCLRDRAIKGSDFKNPNINDSLREYVQIFRDAANDQGDGFDDPRLGPNDTGEFDFFRFEYEHGRVPRRVLGVQTVDYAGEFVTDINTTNPWDEFNKNWANDDDKNTELDGQMSENKLPTLEQLQYLNSVDEINERPDIPALLSAMAAEYDTIGLTLPADEFATNLSQLPDHTGSAAINQRVNRRATSAENYFGTGYFQIYEDLIQTYDNTDFFFIVTMSDVFKKTFKQETAHVDPKPSWTSFRKHIYSKIKEKNEQTGIPFFSQDQVVADYTMYYPVYFQPEQPPDHLTNNGNFKPKLDWDDKYYPLRGLSKLLKRMGR